MASSKTLKIDDFVAKLAADCNGFLIAYSGGADSSALLHLFAPYKNIRVIHINHGISNDAQLWQKHCQQVCTNLSIPLLVEKAQLENSSENACRRARYAFFSKHLKNNEVLLTAHHRDDQIENVLLKLFRSTGLKGLASMSELTRFGKGYLARPLLNVHAHELKSYLKAKKLQWIEDESNQQNHYQRNFIRNKILPAITSHFPNAGKSILSTTENIQNSLALLNHLSAFETKQLPLEKLRNLPENLQVTYLYHWLSQKNQPVMDKKALKQVVHDFLSAKACKNPHFKNKHYQLYRWQDAIHFVANLQEIDPKTYTWDTSKPFIFPNNYAKLEFTGTKQQLQVKFQQTGQKIKTHHHKITKTVKNLFQQHKIPPWHRQNTPFIYYEDQLVSLGYHWSHNEKFKNKIHLTITP